MYFWNCLADTLAGTPESGSLHFSVLMTAIAWKEQLSITIFLNAALCHPMLTI